MRMRQGARELAHAAIYLCGVGALVAGIAYAIGSSSASVVGTFFSWAAPLLDSPEPQPNRLSIMVANAREIRQALARPVPGPEPLPPITAKVAYGHLRPGGKGQVIMAEKKPKLPMKGFNAMAMSTGPKGALEARVVTRNAVPEVHKVY